MASNRSWSVKPNYNVLKRLRNVKRFTFGCLSWIVTLAAGRNAGAVTGCPLEGSTDLAGTRLDV